MISANNATYWLAEAIRTEGWPADDNLTAAARRAERAAWASQATPASVAAGRAATWADQLARGQADARAFAAQRDRQGAGAADAAPVAVALADTRASGPPVLPPDEQDAYERGRAAARRYAAERAGQRESA